MLTGLQLSVAVALPVAPMSVESWQLTVLSAGQVMTGGVVSTNVMCWTQVEELPQASIASQVRSMPAWPVQLAGVAASVNVIVGDPPQLSVAVEVPVFAGAVESP